MGRTDYYKDRIHGLNIETFSVEWSWEEAEVIAFVSGTNLDGNHEWFISIVYANNYIDIDIDKDVFEGMHLKGFYKEGSDNKLISLTKDLTGKDSKSIEEKCELCKNICLGVWELVKELEISK